MNTKISEVFFVRRQSDVSIKISLSGVMKLDQDEQPNAELKPAMTTIADCLSPLLTSMKLFGLYFNSETCDKLTDHQLRGRWNLSVYHSAVIAVLLWINVIRMFSVFTAQEEFGQLIFFKFILSR